MYLYQKFNYSTKVIKSESDLKELVDNFDTTALYGVYDTETTGLNIITDTPFLLVFGWLKTLYCVDLVADPELGSKAVETMYEIFGRMHRFFAHNATYDGHMLNNYGKPIPNNLRSRYADSQTLVRLTTPSDLMYNKNLESVGQAYVDNEAKFAGRVIKGRIKEINSERKIVVRDIYNATYRDRRKTTYVDCAFGAMWEMYIKDRVQFVYHEYDYIFDVFDEHYQSANYYDVYLKYPDLMVSYAFDDIVIMLEYLPKALNRLVVTDPKLTVFNRESDLIIPTIAIDRVGFLLDIPYVVQQRKAVVEYRQQLYEELWELTGINGLSVGQHKVLREMFSSKFGVLLATVDNDALSSIVSDDTGRNKSAEEVSNLIQELRTLDKWLSTYIDGMLNRCTKGRVHTTIDNSGTVSGRVTSNLQQMPKDTIKTRDGVELYHPRKAFVVDKDHYMVVFDYSQQELRVQAFLTILVSGGDLNLCRAYMPYKCVSIATGEDFDFNNRDDIDSWDSGEWVLSEDMSVIWEPTDVHSATTFEAFPRLNYDPTHPEFNSLRSYGKIANFLKNYGGGFNAIKKQLKVDDEIARNLDSAYYRAFPDIKIYQRWVEAQLATKGFVENLYGRRYYMSDSRYFYKAGNYLVQGASADMIKSAILRIYPLFEGKLSKTLMTIHDELDFLIHHTEIDLIPKIRAIMLDVQEVYAVPMAVDVEYSDTSWGEIKAWEGSYE